MKILGIETSCDETAAAVIDGGRVLSNVVSSQVELHGKYFGVVPELASRAHQQKIPGVIEQAVADAFPGARLSDLRELVDAVAFTQGPGLAGALLVGKVAAQTLASVHRLPLIGVNHLEGHAFAIEFTEPVRFPFISLIVSGGHTDLALVSGYGSYRVLGRTRDDAAGEAFDKVAKLLRLGYPGGPIIDRLASKGDPAAIQFPRPILPNSWDFSFSGLKTSVLYHVEGRKNFLSRPLPRLDRDRAGKSSSMPAGAARPPSRARRAHENVRRRRCGDGPAPCPPREKAFQDWEINDLCASFQESVVDTLAEKALAAASEFKAKSVIVGGGVAANSRLRAVLTERGFARGLRVCFPPPSLCTDNGAMIARVAWLRLNNASRKRGRVEPQAAAPGAYGEPGALPLPQRPAHRPAGYSRSARGYRIDPSMPMRNW